LTVTAHINRIATAVPPNDIHDVFVEQAAKLILRPGRLELFRQMAARSQIAHRYSCLPGRGSPRSDRIDDEGFYSLGAFPSTGTRMQRYEREAGPLAVRAVEGLELGEEARRLTHLVLISCTGFVAPGVDFELIRHFGMDPGIERSIVGFMGCHAAINGLKLARHIIRSEPEARVLMVSVELCTLHLQQAEGLEQLVAALVFGDGCAAALITAEEHGLALDSFHAVVVPGTEAHITWRIGDAGFDMMLSGQVPAGIAQALREGSGAVLRGAQPGAIDLWAIHPGGRAVLDAVEAALALPDTALRLSRRVLHDFGNMSSATVMFVLRALLGESTPGQRGCAMAFGPGMTAETMLFHRAGGP
jgi:predicted naringenin-chalcone synthase